VLSLPAPLPRLYAIADVEVLGEERTAAAIETMAASGVGWIQLRAKRLPGLSLDRLIRESLARLAGHEATLWIDDRADLAKIHGLAGVHVGQRDLPPAAARRVVGPGLGIGLSAHGAAQVEAADADPDIDVVAIGPVFPTSSKEQPDPVVGLAGVRDARRRTSKPLVAIGGLDAERAPAILDAGADAVAILGAICRGDVRANCERLLRAAGEAV